MNRQLREQLLDRYREKVASSVKSALNEGSDAELKGKVEELENFSKLLNFTAPKWTADSGVAAAIGLLCVATAGFLWAVRVPQTSVSLSLQTEAMEGSLVDDWHADHAFRSGEMHFEGLARIDDPSLGLSINQPEGSAWIRLAGGQLSLQSLQLGRGSLLQIDADRDEVRLFTSRGSTRATVTLVGGGTLTAGNRPGQLSLTRSYQLDVPETLQLEVIQSRAVPCRFTFHHPQKWRLSKLPLEGLNFLLEEAQGPADDDFTSAVRSGSIAFKDTPWRDFQIPENELLTIHRSGKARIDVESSESSMHVSLNGMVGDVTTGRGEARRRYAPSYLEYFYSNKTMTFFWAAAALIWGFLWGVRKTVFR